MIKGIGIDTTRISRIEKMVNTLTDGALGRLFTEAELSEAANRGGAASYEYLATRFAAKEAVFKALAPLTEKKRFDLRIVETLNTPDGAPYVNPIYKSLQDEKLDSILQETGVTALHISMTTEGDYATAFVIAEGIDGPSGISPALAIITPPRAR